MTIKIFTNDNKITQKIYTQKKNKGIIKEIPKSRKSLRDIFKK